MKTLIITLLFLISFKGFSQDYYTIIAKSYTLSSNGVEKKINGVIALTYSREYSILYIEGKGSLYFQNEQYTRDIQGGGLHENFLSGETSTTLSGHYSISVYHMKNNNIITIGSFATRSSYYAEHAQLYSENGKVTQNPYVKNWKEIIEKEKIERETSASKKDDTGNITINGGNDSEAFMTADEMPEFPGGEIALRGYIAKAINYPSSAKENGIQGKVYVTFIITKDGSISNPKISTGINSDLNNEALRIVNSLPKWIPGKIKGEPVPIIYSIGVNFKLP